jgi:hypothetical protein
VHLDGVSLPYARARPRRWPNTVRSMESIAVSTVKDLESRLQGFAGTSLRIRIERPDAYILLDGLAQLGWRACRTEFQHWELERLEPPGIVSTPASNAEGPVRARGLVLFALLCLFVNLVRRPVVSIYVSMEKSLQGFPLAAGLASTLVVIFFGVKNRARLAQLLAWYLGGKFHRGH